MIPKSALFKTLLLASVLALGCEEKSQDASLTAAAKREAKSAEGRSTELSSTREVAQRVTGGN